ncbi:MULTISPECIES: hypothetical protein [Duganella]|uniref:Uncharacterized protein n=2 Tax=Duganella TaxID=75654 RepID=A0A7X4KG80_9BURK|nr:MULTISPECIES: hypothetical protein [Duganella]MYM72130.1 hypothetical protein [Duganella margarita]MYN30342.1 hypothetical protein [Duganella levis]
MIEPITLTVAELAARWGQTPRQVLQFALHKCFPMYFYFDGLVFDAGDEWHRANGAWLENQERERLEKSIAAGEAQLKRHLQYIQGLVKPTEWEQPMDTDAVKAVRMQIDEDGAQLRHIRERLKVRDTERLACSRNGLVRAMPGTLQSVLERGSEPFPRWGYRPGAPVKIIERNGNQQHLDGHIWALEDARYPKELLTADDLQALMTDIKDIETPATKAPAPNAQSKTLAGSSMDNAEPSTSRHTLKSRSKAILHAEIAEACKLAINPSDTTSVWTELVKLSEKKFGCLIGPDEKEIKYQDGEVVRSFRKRNLSERLARAATRGDA